jgi:exosortase A
MNTAAPPMRPPLDIAPYLLGAALLLPLLAYWRTTVSIEQIWARSDTFAHGYLIAPLSAWLIWRRRDAWRHLAPAPCWPALLPLLLCGVAWLLAELAAVQVLRQLALVAMLPLSVWAMLGTRVTRRLAFPLAFLLFAVPLGDSLIEPLMQLTASFTVAALRLSGIPVLHEGNNFTLPTGSWSVIEACSGLRYLVASATLGCLYAYLTYRSWQRRAAFILAATLLPVLANGLRAYLIVMLGHLSGMTQAMGIDHLLYGWLFFGMLMLTMFAVGGRWRQPEDDQRGGMAGDAGARASVATGCQPSAASLAAMGATLALALSAWPAYAWRLQGTSALPVDLPHLALAEGPATAFTDWQPAYLPPAATTRQFYLHAGRPVGVQLLYYRKQYEGSKLISSSNRLTRMTSVEWHLTSGQAHTVTLSGGRQLHVNEAQLDGSHQRLMVWHWYVIDGHATTSDLHGKLYQAWQQLLSGSDDGAAVMIFTAADDAGTARDTLRGFVSASNDALDQMLSTAGRRQGDAP